MRSILREGGQKWRMGGMSNQSLRIISIERKEKEDESEHMLLCYSATRLPKIIDI